jgi:hypothetical protein
MNYWFILIGVLTGCTSIQTIRLDASSKDIQRQPSPNLTLTVEAWNKFAASWKNPFNSELGVEDLRLAGANCRYVSKELLDDSDSGGGMPWRTRIFEVLAQVEGGNWGIGPYACDIEFGWLVTYIRQTPSPEPIEGLVEISVYLPNVEAPYLEVIPKGRSGWTQQLPQPVKVRTTEDAKKHAEEYLGGLNVNLDKLTRYVAPAIRLSYIPRIQVRSELEIKVRKLQHLKISSAFPKDLANAVTIYRAVDFSGVTSIGYLIRRECYENTEAGAYPINNKLKDGPN